VKLALVCRRLSDQGGTERFVLGLARWLLARGHDVHAWCAEADVAVPGLAVRPLALRGRGRIARMLSLHRASRRIPAGDYDAVLAFARTANHGLYRAGGGCHRAWVERNGWSVADAVEVALDRRAVLSARTVVANSEMAAREIRDHYGIDHGRLQVVRNGVDLKRFRPGTGDLPVPRPAVCFLGSGFARKGLSTAIRAVARLPSVHLAVVGGDRRQGRWERLAQRLGVRDRVHFLGASERPEALLPAASALVLPTRYDSFANAVLEAMACGVPPITSTANGAAEVLPEPWMAIPDPEDDLAFSLALERALQSDGLAAECRRAAEARPAEGAFARMEELAQELCP
jgi:UDP-glucose:(heptosyl)LPS alpha-1,3-glucosyltransferase